MTHEDIEKAARLYKDAGHSKLPLPINVIHELIAKAKAFDALPPITKEVWK